MTDDISVATLRGWLFGEGELALLDVREPGQIAEGHILFSAPLPYSRFELGLPALVPNRAVRMVLCDDGDGAAARAADRARGMGYSNVACLEGGVAGWARAGHTLYQGVNVPSKAFGELVEHAAGTPRLPAEDVARMQAERANMVIVDGRPFAEYRRFNIPGGQCCPNGELALRIDRLAPDPATTVVVNCAGRTRSIIGAQTLIDLGVPNPVYALENGTQGWTLADLELERGARGALPPAGGDLSARRERALALAARHGVEAVSAGTLVEWLLDAGRTVYLLDIRTEEERTDDPAEMRETLSRHGVVHAPGGQLVQATDQWIGVRRARLVVLDTEELRAPVIASWLRRLGHEAVVAEGGIGALRSLEARAPVARAPLPELDRIAPDALEGARERGQCAILDLRPSGSYRAGHVPGAAWATRPRLPRAASGQTVLVADGPEIAQLAAIDLAEAGASGIVLLDGGHEAWQAAGLPVEASPDTPPDAERIDFIGFTHGRHDGNAEASRQYLAWEIALVDQLDTDERAVFRI